MISLHTGMHRGQFHLTCLLVESHDPQVGDNRLRAALQPQTPPPDLVIYLQAPVESLIERVRRRGVAYESPITEDYLARLAESYSRYFYQYEASPLLIVNSEHLNFADQPQDFELLLERIGQMRGGREYFNRAG